MALAAGLRLPLVLVIDTAGPALSAEAEQGGLAGEIARCLAELVTLDTPTVSVLLGQGSGGPALAMVPADRVLAALHGWLAPLPPEGASAIVFRDVDHAPELAAAQGIRSADLLRNGIVDAIVAEHPDAADEPDGVHPVGCRPPSPTSCTGCARCPTRRDWPPASSATAASAWCNPAEMAFRQRKCERAPAGMPVRRCPERRRVHPMARAASIPAHVTRLKGNRNMLRRIHRRAAASSTSAGSFRSNSTAFGTRSNADQILITAWLTSATSSGTPISLSPQVSTTVTTSSTSNTVCTGSQNRTREMPPLRDWMMPGRVGQNGSTTSAS